MCIRLSKLAKIPILEMASTQKDVEYNADYTDTDSVSMYLLRRLPSVLCVRPLVQVKLNNSQGYVHTMEQIVRLGFVRKVAFRHNWRALGAAPLRTTGLLVQVYGILFIQVPPVSTVSLRASAPLLALYALAKRCDGILSRQGRKSADACQGLAALGNACRGLAALGKLLLLRPATRHGSYHGPVQRG
jgi:hypothetical protein